MKRGDMKAVMPRVPAYWPILYALYRLKRICNSFELQKYLYLAKRDGNVPIEYAFVDDYCGRPCCTCIKQEAIFLGERGYIQVSFENGWIFEITDEGAKQVEVFMNELPVEVQKSFDHILEEYSSLPLVKLRDYLYGSINRSKPREEHELLKKQLLVETEHLLHEFSDVESNGNSLFIRGSIDYCLLILKREHLDDLVQKDNLLAFVDGYINKIQLLKEITGGNAEILEHICLNDFKEDFELVQEASMEYNVLPALYDENIDLSVFVEDC
ncbi:MAG: hypothetical protein WAV32_08875 [Halobacteriota archaeon]